MSDDRFLTTRWSLVLAAGAEPSPHARAALEDLCAAYWAPLYAYLRRRGHAPAEAEDLVQGLFALLLDRRDLALADRSRGRFRSFLLTALEHHLANERERKLARKRGGGAKSIPIDASTEEGRLALEVADASDTPERAYERAWARAVLDRALARLTAEQEHAKKGALFAALRPQLAAREEGGAAYARIAADLGLTENAVKVAAHRLRRRYGELLREEVARTVEDDADVEAEIRELFRVLSA